MADTVKNVSLNELKQRRT